MKKAHKAFAERLTARILRLTEQDAQNAGARAPVTLDQQAVGRLSRMDAIQNQAIAKSTANRRQTEIIKAKLALKRIEDDEFGWCSDCGEDIEPKRLEYDPTIALCITCAQG